MALNKTVLLPRRWQKVGWWMIVASVVLAAAIAVVEINGIRAGFPIMASWIPAVAGLLLICLSQEKTEDEYIRHLRGKIVSIIVAIAIIAKMTTMIVSLICNNFGWVPVTIYFMGLSILYNPIVLTVGYIIALKLSLYFINRKMNRYAEE